MLQFIDNVRSMASSLSNLVNNLSEENVNRDVMIKQQNLHYCFF